jgi:hypothetical protein
VQEAPGAVLAQCAPLWLDLEQQPGQWEEEGAEEQQEEGAARVSALPAVAEPGSPEREPLLAVAALSLPSAPRS